MDKREDIIDKVGQYKQLVVNSNLLKNIEQVYLFGSFAKGTSNNYSDIDVAFVVKHIDGDFFDIIPPINRLTEKIDMRIEPHIIERDADYAGFLDEILRTGVLIN
jgi:predicted nucleotidyltransferase